MAQEVVGSSPITHPIDQKFISGCGAVRLAHLLWEQGVGSSNLSTPTRGKPLKSNDKPLLIERLLFCVKYRIAIYTIWGTDLGDTVLIHFL